MESGHDIDYLAREARNRWLKPVEVLFILQNHEEHQLTHQVPQKPAGGSLYLFNKRVLKYFRKDGHNWRRRKDQRTIAEAHERLKVGNVEALNCYYAHGKDNPNLQRRSFWMLDPVYEHIVLVHYRDVGEGKQDSGSSSSFPGLSSSLYTPSPNSFVTHETDSSLFIDEPYELHTNLSSPSSVEISSSQVQKINRINQSDIKVRESEPSGSPTQAFSEALRRIEQHLSLDDDEVTQINEFYDENEYSNDYLSGREQDDLENMLSQRSDHVTINHQLPQPEVCTWDKISDSSKMLDSSRRFSNSSTSTRYHAYSPLRPNPYQTTPDCYSYLRNEDVLAIPPENGINLIIPQTLKYTIREISPEWCYTSEGAKIIIVGSFLSDTSECAWACMFGETEVPIQIIQEGVLCCHAPPHLQGTVDICITSGDRKACSEVRKFEYRAKANACNHNDLSEAESKSLDELLLLVRFVQMLLSSDQLHKGDASSSTIDLEGRSEVDEDKWSDAIYSILDGTSTSSRTVDWILQELMKDKLHIWLSSRRHMNDHEICCLSKKEQGIIHIIAGLGYEWALQPILSSGVSINFRDINGWTALHWAAKFGREKMVAALIVSGASAGAVTDPNSQDPTGKTPASIAAACGHIGLAGYLSEVALTSHLSSLTMEESDQSKESAALEAETTLDWLSNECSSAREDQASLKHTLAAVRNAAQAAARIQSAFRAHSFRKRQQRVATKTLLAGAIEDDYSILENDIQGLAAASKLAFRNTRDSNSAALSIQKKYRGWKGRKDFVALRQKVVKIQAHVRGYQVRKNYKVCWAVGILDKVILRWRRRGVGLRGYRPDLESIDESEEEDILKVFRKQKVDAALDEAVSRVLSMVDSPDARQQYHRILQKFVQAKAERGNAESDISSFSLHDEIYEISGMDNDDIFTS